MINQNVDRRVLGAFICVDAITQAMVTEPMLAAAPLWKLKPNRSGVYVIFNGPNLSDATTQFIPGSNWPQPVKFDVTLQDPNRIYLPRRAQVQAPESVPDIPAAPPGSAGNPAVTAALGNTATVFAPQPVTVFRAPSAPVGPNWATLHVSVTRSGITPLQGVPWAVLRVVRNSDSKVMVNGLADLSGEALLSVLGSTLETSTTTTGSVTLASVAVTVTAYTDPSTFTSIDARKLVLPPGWIPNPDDILKSLPNANLKSASQVLQLSSGSQSTLNLAIPI